MEDAEIEGYAEEKKRTHRHEHETDLLGWKRTVDGHDS